MSIKPEVIPCEFCEFRGLPLVKQAVKFYFRKDLGFWGRCKDHSFQLQNGIKEITKEEYLTFEVMES